MTRGESADGGVTYLTSTHDLGETCLCSACPRIRQQHEHRHGAARTGESSAFMKHQRDPLDGGADGAGRPRLRAGADPDHGLPRGGGAVGVVGSFNLTLPGADKW